MSEKTLSEMMESWSMYSATEIFSRIAADIALLEHRVARLESDQTLNNHYREHGRCPVILHPGKYPEGQRCVLLAGHQGDHVTHLSRGEQPRGAVSQPESNVASPEGTAGGCQTRGSETPEQIAEQCTDAIFAAFCDLLKPNVVLGPTRNRLKCAFLDAIRLGQSQQPTSPLPLDIETLARQLHEVDQQEAKRQKKLREIIHWTETASFEATKARLRAHLAELRAGKEQP